jgi:hypothetical protein
MKFGKERKFPPEPRNEREKARADGEDRPV